MSGSQFDRVAGLLRSATLANEDIRKVEHLRKVKELIINHDSSLLDNFFEEVVAFQHYPNTEVKKFIVKFIQDACLVDAGLLLKSVGCLSHLFNLSLHQEPPLSSLLRSVISAMCPLYRRALSRAVKCGFIESGALGGGGIEAGSVADYSLEHFRAIAALKDEIIRLILPEYVGVMQGTTHVSPPNALLTRLCTLISDAARTGIISLIETVIITQSRRMPTSVLPRDSELDVSLEQIPELPNSLLKSIIESSTAGSSTTSLPGICLIRPRRLADEAERLLTGLTNLPLKRGNEASLRLILTGPVFDAIVDSLVNIARQRPQFLEKAVQTFETVHVNLPPHFSQMQVGLARQKLKSGLLALLQQSSVASDFQSRITILLTDLGATRSEVINAMHRTNEGRPRASPQRVTSSNRANDRDMSGLSVRAQSSIESTPHSDAPSDPRKRSSTSVENAPNDSKRKRPETPSVLRFGEDDDDDDEDDEETELSKLNQQSISSTIPQTMSKLAPVDPRIAASSGRRSIGGGDIIYPSTPSNPSSVHKKSTKSGGIPEIDDIANGLVPKLTSANVADLVLLSMVMLPDQMPAAFNATYTPIAAAGTDAQIRHLARLLSAQLAVWVNREEDAKTRDQNRQLLMKLFEIESAQADASGENSTVATSGTAGVTSAGSGKKSSSIRSRKSKVDEDDEAAFMRAHAARVHGTVKPMNISVLHSGSSGTVGSSVSDLDLPSGSLLIGSLMPPLIPPPNHFDPHMPPPPLPVSSAMPPIAVATKNVASRPFCLESVVTQISQETQRTLARDAYMRILCADSLGYPNRPDDACSTSATLLGSGLRLAAYDSTRIKLLCRLPNKRFASSELYSAIIDFAMENLKDGYELLANLLMHEYTMYRGFKLKSFGSRSPPTIVSEACPSGRQQVADEEMEDSLLLEQSKQQLRALAKLKREESLEAQAGFEGLYDEGGIEGTDTRRSSSDMCLLKTGSLSYDALLTDILTRLSAPTVKETYFGRLLLEAPLLTATAISSLKRYCWGSDRAPYGFQILRSLIQFRPIGECKDLLNVLLNFASVEDAKIRKAALKAVCELADSHLKWQEKIEGYAVARLKKLLLSQPTPDLFPLSVQAALPTHWTDEACQSCAYLLLGLMPRNPRQLLLTLAEVYVDATANLKRTLLRMMDTSICEIGLHSPDLLNLIDECPMGAESLVTRMISILTDPRTALSRHTRPSTIDPVLPAAGTATTSTSLLASTTSATAPTVTVSSPNVIPVMPPAALVDRMRNLYSTRVHDVRCLIPVLVGLSKQEVIAALPQLVQLNEKVVKEVISRLLHASVATIPAPDPRICQENPAPTDAILGPLTPEELLVAIHLLEFAKDPSAPPDDSGGQVKPFVEIRVILRACLHCFAERRLFTQERLSAAIGQLLDQPVLPTLFLRTVMQALALYPRLAGYVINVLFRLIRKQVWKSPTLWDGFIRCCVKTRPQSYQVLLQLPPQQLQSVFEKETTLRAQVRRYVENFSSAQRMHISRAVIDVLDRESSPSNPADALLTTDTQASCAVGTATSKVSEKVSSSTDTASVSESITKVTKSEAPTIREDEHLDVDGRNNSPVASAGSATPTRDEEPMQESVAVLEARRMVQLVSDANFQLSFESSFADDGSMSPPSIVSSAPVNADIPGSRSRQSMPAGAGAQTPDADSNVNQDADSYSPPPVPSVRRVGGQEEPHSSVSTGEMSISAISVHVGSSVRPIRSATKRLADDETFDAEQRRLNEVSESYSNERKQRKQDNNA